MKEEIIHFDDNYSGGYTGGPKFYLEHSCDDWVIGKLEDAKAFYEELGRKIQEVEASTGAPPGINP